MLYITVAQEGVADFRTITEAVQSVPYALPARIEIGPGVYEEKLFCEKRDITLAGSGPARTVLRWADGARHLHADGTPFGTFRSYTAFFGGESVTVKDLTIENAAGDGETHGQAMAVYADARRVVMENVCLRACQDTLFLAPLPQKERLPRGFYGPRALAPRVPTQQYYRDCRIQGDIDFIFGGADAVFERCELFSSECGGQVCGYVAAPSGDAARLGFVFVDCRFTSDCAKGTVYLGRPWRPQGKVTLLRCELGAHIRPEGWDGWVNGEAEPEACFAEYACTGPGAKPGARVVWAKRLSRKDAQALLVKALALKTALLNR